MCDSTSEPRDFVSTAYEQSDAVWCEILGQNIGYPLGFQIVALTVNKGWMKHTLESRFLGEISITSVIQMTPPLWQRLKRN